MINTFDGRRSAPAVISTTSSALEHSSQQPYSLLSSGNSSSAKRGSNRTDIIEEEIIIPLHRDHRFGHYKSVEMSRRKSATNAQQPVAMPTTTTASTATGTIGDGDDIDDDAEHGGSFPAATSSPPTSTTTTCKAYQNPRYLLAALLASFIVFAIVDSFTNQYILNAAEGFLEWIEDNPIAGFFIFVLVYAGCTILLLPGTILTLGAGYVFAKAFHGVGIGTFVGSLVVVVGATIGGSCSFVIGRFLLRDCVSRSLRSSKYILLHALDIAIEEKGFRIMSLLRLSPVIPFNVLNYIAGVTAVGFFEFLFAFWAIIPGTVFYVFLGASAGSLMDIMKGNASANSRTMLILVILGVLLGICAVGLISYYARLQLKKIVAQREEDEEAQAQDSQEHDLPQRQQQGHGSDPLIDSSASGSLIPLQQPTDQSAQ